MYRGTRRKEAFFCFFLRNLAFLCNDIASFQSSSPQPQRSTHRACAPKEGAFFPSSSLLPSWPSCCWCFAALAALYRRRRHRFRGQRHAGGLCTWPIMTLLKEIQRKATHLRGSATPCKLRFHVGVCVARALTGCHDARNVGQTLPGCHHMARCPRA